MRSLEFLSKTDMMAAEVDPPKDLALVTVHDGRMPMIMEGGRMIKNRQR